MPVLLRGRHPSCTDDLGQAERVGKAGRPKTFHAWRPLRELDQ
jgi:hypothetical protein